MKTYKYKNIKTAGWIFKCEIWCGWTEKIINIYMNQMELKRIQML